MSEPAIHAMGLSKLFTLGVFDRRALHEEITYWWHRIRGRNPLDYMGKIKANTNTYQDGNKLWALKDITFSVHQGEVLGVIGRNGAGKSTLLKILGRITAPTHGEAIINGRVGSLLEVGTGFHPELTGRENIYMNGTILGMKKKEVDRKLDEIVAFSEMEKFIETPVKRYSSGMYVRLAFAVAAHMEPEILLVDEVLAVGDMEFQKKCLGKMQDVSESGRTILFVSHNMPAITRLCSKAILLDKGRITMEGDAEDVVSRYVARSLGSSAVREWAEKDAPGEHGIKLRSISILDMNGQPTGSLDIRNKIKIRIFYEISVAELRFRCAVNFHTQGVCAFTAVEPVEHIHHQKGCYETEIDIPGNIFAEGEYLVTIGIFASRGKKLRYCWAVDAVAFMIYDTIEGGSARGDYAEGFGGVMRPLLQWRKKYIG